MTNTTALSETPALPEKMQQENTAMARQIAQLTVTDAESYTMADGLGRQIKGKITAIKAFFEPMRVAADQAKKAVLQARDDATRPLEEAETYLNRQVSAYRREQQRIQQEAQAKKDAEERERIAKQRAAEAEAARAKGREKLAQVIESAPIEVATEPVANPDLPKTGSALRQYWKFRVVDPALVPREWCCPDEKAIGQFVRDKKEAAKDAIPGVEVYPDDKTTW